MLIENRKEIYLPKETTLLLSVCSIVFPLITGTVKERGGRTFLDMMRKCHGSSRGAEPRHVTDGVGVAC